MNINYYFEFLTLFDTLSEFVKTVCAGRDESHGYNHMKSVCFNSLRILNDELKNIKSVDINEIFRDTIIVALLHDVADYKYDFDGTLRLKVENFIKEISTKPDLLINIIDRISYSKEAKTLKQKLELDWSKILGNYGCVIRDIVSDADKLEALGKIGFDRCIEFTKHIYKSKYGNDISHEMLVNEVREHANDKLLRLKDEFIRTSTGKLMAHELHNELVNELKNM